MTNKQKVTGLEVSAIQLESFINYITIVCKNSCKLLTVLSFFQRTNGPRDTFFRFFVRTLVYYSRYTITHKVRVEYRLLIKVFWQTVIRGVLEIFSSWRITIRLVLLDSLNSIRPPKVLLFDIVKNSERKTDTDIRKKKY